MDDIDRNTALGRGGLSDQQLQREALAQAVNEGGVKGNVLLTDWTVFKIVEAIEPMLAAQPVVASVVACGNCDGDEFVCGACGVRAEAHLASQPVVDREAVDKVLSAHELKGGPGFYEGQYRTQFFCECGTAIYQDRHTGEMRDEGHRAHVADAVLSLLNGSAK